MPVGAPVYGLEPTADWVPFADDRTPAQAWAEVEAFFGRPLSEDENLLFVLLGLAEGDTAADWAQLERALERGGAFD